MDKKTILLSAPTSVMTSGASHSVLYLAKSIKDSDRYMPLVLLPKEGELRKRLDEYEIETYIIPQWNKWTNSIAYTKNVAYIFIIFVRFVRNSLLQVFSPFQYRRLRSLLVEKQVDLVHINSFTHGMVSVPANELHIPIVWHVREFLEEDLSYTWARPVDKIRKINQAARVIAVSEAVKAKYEKIIQPPIDVIPNGIHFENILKRNRVYQEGDIFKIVIAGRITRKKGQLELCQAISLLSEDDRARCEVTILGNINDQEYWSEVIRIIEEKELGNVIHYGGFSDHVLEKLTTIDCLCMCSTNEAFGRVTVEGMMAGCVVIGANTGGTTEIINNGVDGLLYQQGNPNDLAEKVAWCIHNPSDVNRLGKAGQKTAREKYSDICNARQVMEIYDMVIEKSDHNENKG